MTLLVGLTGGMGAGKSLVASLLKKCGAKILDADQVCRDLVQPEKPAWNEIVQYFGSDILEEDHSLNRRKLGILVFGDPEKKKILEDILHPKVFSAEKKAFEALQKRDAKGILVVEAALLIESGNFKNMDRVIVVGCERTTQIDRILKKGIWSREEIIQRLDSQMSLEEKIKKADFVIYNDLTIAALESRVKQVFCELQTLLD